MPTGLILWYFYRMAGLGGWIIFLFLALGAVFYIWYDSGKRNLPVLGWRVGVLILALLLLPTLIYRFSVTSAQFENYINCMGYYNATVPPPIPAPWKTPEEACVNVGAVTPLKLVVFPASPPMAPYYEIVFYLGILGGILSLAVALAYYLNFQGMRSPSRAPVQGTYRVPQQAYAPPAPNYSRREPAQAVAPPRQKKQLARAWLVAQDGHTYQLVSGETCIGRSAENDIYLTGDTTISKQHAKVVEQNDHFRLFDLGSTNGTRVNGQYVRQPALLEADDEVQFGDHTVMRFVTTRN